MNLHPDLTPLPERMKSLPVDERGYPVPWFVAWVDGRPEFRAMDGEKLVRAVREKRCWVCGQRLGVHVTFVIGPMCIVNRVSAEPPSHFECGLWSAVNCPFINNPKAVRREDERITNAHLRETSAGCALARNPGVMALWTTRSFEVFDDGQGKPLFQIGEPESVKYFREGREATPEEVRTSVDSGLPNLEAMAQGQPGAMEALNRAIKRAEKYLPQIERRGNA